MIGAQNFTRSCGTLVFNQSDRKRRLITPSARVACSNNMDNSPDIDMASGTLVSIPRLLLLLAVFILSFYIVFRYRREIYFYAKCFVFTCTWPILGVFCSICMLSSPGNRDNMPKRVCARTHHQCNMTAIFQKSWNDIFQCSVLLFFSVLAISLAVSRSVRFFFKYYIFTLGFAVLGLAGTPFMLMSPWNVDKNVRWAGLLTRHTVKHIYGIKINMKGLEHLQCQRPFIIVCNHQSTVDNVGMMEVVPRYTVCMMKKSLKYAGPFGLAAMLCGTIFVDRSNPERAKQATEETVEIILEEKVNLWMFPEGHRNMMKQREDHMLPFKKGAFNIAVKAQVPIIPIVMSSQEPFFSFKHKRFTSGVQNIEVLPAVPTKGLTLEDVPDLADQVRKDMLETFVRISPNLHSNGPALQS